MKTRTGKDNDQTRLAKQIDARDHERAALRDELRTIQQQIQALIRRAAEKVKETVKGLVRGQPDRADTSDEPPKPASQPQHGGERGADDDWIPGQGFLDRGR